MGEAQRGSTDWGMYLRHARLMARHEAETLDIGPDAAEQIATAAVEIIADHAASCLRLEAHALAAAKQYRAEGRYPEALGAMSVAAEGALLELRYIAAMRVEEEAPPAGTPDDENRDREDQDHDRGECAGG